jgi:hypothetical protein
MDESIFQQPTPEQLKQFVDGDPIAIDEVIELVLPQLHNWGKRRYSSLPEQDIYSVIHDVLNETCQKHERYNPKLARFTTYVIDLIIKRMATLQRSRIKLTQQEVSLENLSEKSEEPTYNTIETDITRRVDRENFFRRARSQLSELEAAFLDLMLEGEIHQEPFIVLLSRSGTTTNLSREVNNTKERVKYKLSTFAQIQGLHLEDFL